MDRLRVDPSVVVRVAHVPHGMRISVVVVLLFMLEEASWMIDSRLVALQSAESRLELQESGWKIMESRTRGRPAAASTVVTVVDAANIAVMTAVLCSSLIVVVAFVVSLTSVIALKKYECVVLLHLPSSSS